jgi:outer membrane receptor protein involved in Fe transport
MVRALVLALCTLASSAVVATAAELAGRVTDRSGGAIAGARVTLLTTQRSVIAAALTDSNGAYRIEGVPDGTYALVAAFPRFSDRLAAVVLGPDGTQLDLVLDPAGITEQVTITATPDGLAEQDTLSQPVNIIGREQILSRTKTIVAQVADGEPGVHLQRTSPGMAGIFVRGLTGNKVNVFVDGVRYSNGAQRGGVNTFLDLIDPSLLDRVEILRGPSSAQYGSDALGGSLQFLSQVPMGLVPASRALSGMAAVGGETAHRGGVGTVRLGYATGRLAVSGVASSRKTGDYRPGGGTDSHSAIPRFLGLPTSALIGDRMPETGFTQVASQLRATVITSRSTRLNMSYTGTRQDGANRWDQILGGDGNLIAELNDLSLDLFTARFEAMDAAGFDHASLTYSLNSQHEERANQGGNGNPTATISHEPETTTVHGIQFNAARRLSSRTSVQAGGDVYFETLESVATNVNPVTGAVSPRRPRVPDGAVYRQGGAFVQAAYDVSPDTLAVTGALRVGFNRYRAEAADAPVVGGQPLWPDDSLSTSSVTFRTGLSYTPTRTWTIFAALASGYRAPHMTDLGTLGLTGSGFEVAAPDLAGRTAWVGDSAASTATSTGRPVEQVGSETSLNLDFGASARTRRLRTRVDFFVNRITDNIQKQALILPPGAVGTTVGGQPITSQTSNGTVFVALSPSPVLVRANFDNARVWGIELSGEFLPTDTVSFGSMFTALRARDTATGLPPNIEGGTPAPGGSVWARYMRLNGRWWVEPYTAFALNQPNLSSLDKVDRRTGAERTRASIQSFFRNGARARGWVDSGPDGVLNNADDRLLVTGETLSQVQDRVLGVGVNSSYLVTTIPGYALVGTRLGWRAGPHLLVVDFENLTDTNYRGISWGMDGAGRGISARYQLTF